MPAVARRLVVFVDEIDVVRSLPFSTDEFFAGIRECYNRRALDPAMSRLTFCLLGVASPNDLIQDTRITPFNIGRRIELRDFSEADAGPLVRGLRAEERGEDEPGEKTARAVLERVLYWTGGHPYLTQKLCQEVVLWNADAAHAEKPIRGRAGVDTLCAGLFLSARALERDDNLIFVREQMLSAEGVRDGLLDLYQRVLGGQPVADEEGNPLVGRLRLVGITRSAAGRLQVRNRIYGRVFDREWVLANLSPAEVARQRRAYRLGRRRAWRALGYGVAGLVLLFALFVVEERVRWRLAVKGLVGELKAKGERLTVPELAPPLSPAPRDMSDFFAAAGRLPAAMVTSSGGEVQLPNGQSLSWAELARQMEQAAEPLDIIRAALATPPLTAGWSYPDAILRHLDQMQAVTRIVPPTGPGPLAEYISTRTAAQWLVAAALSELHQGRMESALENYVALTACARLRQGEPVLVNQMIRVAVVGLMCFSVQDVLRDERWTDGQLKRLQEAWQAVEVRAPVCRALEMERAVFLANPVAFQYALGGFYQRSPRWGTQSQGRPREFRRALGDLLQRVWGVTPDPADPLGLDRALDGLLWRLWKLGWQDCTRFVLLQQSQEAINTLRAMETTPWVATHARLSERLERPRTGPFSPGFVEAAAANWRVAFLTMMRNEALREVIGVALAAKRYQLRAGKPPLELAALVPDYLAAAPLDPMDRKPLRYKVSPEGGWVLYSIGSDGIDGGGAINPVPPDPHPPDIGVRVPASAGGVGRTGK